MSSEWFVLCSLSGYLVVLLFLSRLGVKGPVLSRVVTHGVSALGKLLINGGTALATGSVAGLIATFSGELGWLTPQLALFGVLYGTVLCLVGGVVDGRATDEIEGRATATIGLSNADSPDTT